MFLSKLQLLPGWLRWPLLVTGGFSAFLVSALYLLQEKIIYVPRIPGLPRQYIAKPLEYDMDHRDVWCAYLNTPPLRSLTRSLTGSPTRIETSDGVKLHAWLVHKKNMDQAQVNELPYVVFLQENAGNMSHRLHWLRALVHILNCKCVILQYRGYGESQGTPSEVGLQRDVDALMDWVTSRPDYAAKRTLLFGRSLGGAVAIYAAVQHKGAYKAMVVENTFTSIEAMAGVAFPPLRLLVGEGKWFNWLVRWVFELSRLSLSLSLSHTHTIALRSFARNKWRSIERIGKLKDVPILFLVSLADEIVHPGQMQKLFVAGGGSANEAWRLCEFAEARHMDAYHTHAPLYWPEVKRFYDEQMSMS